MGLMKWLNDRLWKWSAKKDRKLSESRLLCEDTFELTDIPYGKHGRENTLDIYLPENYTGRLPVIINAHGGGYCYGDKDNNKGYCSSLAKQGFIVVNANYRLVQDAKYPAQIRDLFKVFNFIENNSLEYPFDLENVFLTGSSAGAHLMGICACVLNTPQLKEKFKVSSNIKVKAINFSCGVFEFMKFKNLPLLRNYQEIIFGKHYTTNEFYHYSSVYELMDNNFPPVSIISTKSDPLRFYSKRMIKELEKHGIPYSSVYIKDHKNFGHVFNINHPLADPVCNMVNQNTLHFFNKYTTKPNPLLTNEDKLWYINQYKKTNLTPYLEQEEQKVILSQRLNELPNLDELEIDIADLQSAEILPK